VTDYKFYFRKSSFKKDLKSGKLLLDIINFNKPKNFLEIGVLEGATSRNICELLNIIHDGNFTFTGIDLFVDYNMKNINKEFTPISMKFSNPLKWIYFKFIIKAHPGSEKAVNFLLKKFNNSIKLYKGYSKDILKKINLKDKDFVFLDGGHSYETVKEDLNILLNNLSNNKIIVCDDYNIPHYGVRKAVDEIKNKCYFENLGRFALLKIKK
tara:strand:+ start:3169 stop:3801 length:633 start_codon:yes stop_codon:yes gene_type:complete